MSLGRTQLHDADDALALAERHGREGVLALAGRLRREFSGNAVELCSIVNVKSGRCGEDCAFCAQSGHHATGVEAFGPPEAESLLQQARQCGESGIARLSLVSSGRGPTARELETYLGLHARLAVPDGPCICASHGLLTEDEASLLFRTGVGMYHHNLEAGPSFFPRICTSHSFEDRVATIRAAAAAGLAVCSGGIFGMGESLRDRLEMAFVLRDLAVASIPLNVLRPIPGTPLENVAPLDEEELLLCVALFRIIHPRAVIRIAGGRPLGFEREREKLLAAGVNGFMVGNYLTTTGVPLKEDLDFFRSNGLDLKRIGSEVSGTRT